MITLNNVTLRRGPRALLEQASFTIYGGWHVGVIGRNGTGKSSLFAALLGELQSDKGDIGVQKGLAIATVAQETPALPDLAIEYALDGDLELRQLERELVAAEDAHDLHRISDIHERLNTIGGYAARARAARLLHGLGFSSAAQSQPVASFSGGWRMRLNLARALMCRSDLLLLDEPTNHLDLDAVIWLQDWLVTFPGTLLVISHDREFLDAVTTHTLHLENARATLYTGNYSQFERQRAEKLALQSAAYAKQQRQVAHLQSFINRFKAKASKATQAQSRIKQLERMQLVAPAHFDSEFSFELPEPDRLPAPLIRVDNGSAGYGSKVILSGIKLLIAPGDRIGLLGPNGAGKSTLVRTLAGELPTLAGDHTRSPHLRVGYFAQHQLEQLDPGASPLLHLKRLDQAAGGKASEQELRGFLGGFNFRGDRVFEAVEPFSGGEKARLCLALVVYLKPNLLLLDEPTNHLDLDMRHALETALTGFAGAVVLVSHDRHMLATTCDDLWRVSDGRCLPFEGDLDDYARWLTSRDKSSQTPDATAAVKADSRVSAKDRRKAGADERALRAAAKKLDDQLNRLHAELKTLDERLADPALYAGTPGEEVKKLQRTHAALRERISTTEEQWLATEDQLDALGASLAPAATSTLRFFFFACFSARFSIRVFCGFFLSLFFWSMPFIAVSPFDVSGADLNILPTRHATFALVPSLLMKESPASFAGLSLSPPLLGNLDSLGYRQMTPVQAMSLPPILAGQDVIAQAKTGSGKTAAFGLGLLARLELTTNRVQALVLCPTRELADQVSKEIRRLARALPNIKVQTLCGGMPLHPQVASLSQHEPHVVVGTPGRIQELLRKKHLHLAALKVLVLDEADRMLDMGFEDQINEIISKTPAQRQTLLFSATYPDSIRAVSQRVQKDPVEITVESTHGSDVIEQQFFEVEHARKLDALAGLLIQHQPESAVVFCNTRIDTGEVTNQLRQRGFSVAALQGDMEQRERDQVLLCFANRSCAVLVATDVAARGLDIKDLPAVINYELPKDPDIYVHRIGRTGRAGKTGLALSLVSGRERNRVSAIEEQQGIEARWGKIAVPARTAKPAAAQWVTLRIDGGRRDKLRPGDILGALTGAAGLDAGTVGKIDIFDTRSYVAIHRRQAGQALERLGKGKIKNRKFRVQPLES